MKAIVYERYGSPDVVHLRDVDKPVVVSDDDVVVRVHAASVNPLDWHYMRGLPYLIRTQAGWRTPKSNRLGVDVAGEVEAVGTNVTAFRPGDEVFGHCAGAFAEYARTRESELVPKPANVTFEQAAAVPVAALTALQGLRDKGRVQAGQTVLVNGAAGGVGTFAVQIAKAFGATVTGVCSTRNLDMVRSIGADHVIDYTHEDFARGAERYDLVIDNVGNHSLADLRRALRAKGVLVLLGAPGGNWIGPISLLLKATLSSRLVSQDLLTHLAKVRKEDLVALKDLLESGAVKPVIDRTYPLSETAEAIRYLEAGHARGKVVITV